MSARAWLWGGLVLLNLVVLVALGLRVTAVADRVEAGLKPVGPAWGETLDRAIEAEGVDGERVVLPAPDSAYTAVFLTPPLRVGQVETVAAELRSSFSPEEVRMVTVTGPSGGEDELLTAGGAGDVLTLVSDSEGRVRSGLGISGNPEESYTLLLDREGRVELSVASLVPPAGLRDLLDRRILGASPVPRAFEALAEDSSVRPDVVRTEILDGVERTVVRARRVSPLPAHRMVRDPAGRLYLLNRPLHRVDVLDPRGRPVEVLGGFGQGSGELMLPVDLAITSDGSLAVVEQGNARLQVFDGRLRPRAECPVEPHASSVTIPAPGRFWIAGARTEDRITEVDVESGRMATVVRQPEVPWVAERLRRLVPEARQRRRLTDTFEYALGRLLLRHDSQGSPLGLSVWKPELYRYDEKGRKIATARLTSPGIDEIARQVRAQVEDAVDHRRVELSFLFQDFAPVPGGGVAIALTGECPSLVETDASGRVVREICPTDPDGRPLAVVSVLAETPTSRLVADSTGVYRFELPLK